MVAIGKVELALRRTWWEGFMGNFREHGLLLSAQLHLENNHLRGVHNICWQYIPLYVESMLAALGVTPLLMDFESMTVKTRACGVSKTATRGKLRWPCAILHLLIKLRWVLLRAKRKRPAMSCFIWDMGKSFYELNHTVS